MSIGRYSELSKLAEEFSTIGTSPQIDIDSALHALDGDRELLCDLANIFCEDAPLLLQELDAGLQQSDFQAVRRSVHSIKGLVSGFFASETTNLAAQLEAAAIEHDRDVFDDGGLVALQESVQALIDTLHSRGLVSDQT